MTTEQSPLVLKITPEKDGKFDDTHVKQALVDAANLGQEDFVKRLAAALSKTDEDVVIQAHKCPGPPKKC